MALERLIGNALIDSPDLVAGQSRSLGWSFLTTATGKVFAGGWVRMPNTVPPGGGVDTVFVTGTKFQIWKRATPVSASVLQQSIEIGGGIVTGPAGSWQPVPGVAPDPLVQNDKYLVDIYQPDTEPSNYWFKSGFGNPTTATMTGNCIFTTGAAVTIPPQDETFGNGGFGVDIGIDDAPTPITVTIDATLPPLDSALTLAAPIALTVDAVLPPLDAALTVSAPAGITLDAILPPLDSALTLSAPAGITLDAVLPPLDAALLLDVPIALTLDAILPPLDAALDVDVVEEINNITLDIVLPPLDSHLVLSAPAGITIDAVLPPLASALTVENLAPIPGIADRMFAPILTALRDCLCHELESSLWGKVCACLIVRRSVPLGDCTPGLTPSTPGGNGVAWVRKIDVTPFLGSQSGDRCVNELVAQIELGVTRCVEVPDDGSMGDLETLQDEALKFESDDAAVRRAVRCCKLPGDPQVTLARWLPLSTGGGCGGSTQIITVRVKIT